MSSPDSPYRTMPCSPFLDISQPAPLSQPASKVINDPIHGHFDLSSEIVRLIDTPHFQRLRDLKQLGGTYFVYPGASHNRFEHSVGVSHVSDQFVSKLYNNRRDPYAKSWYDGEDHFQRGLSLVRIAGLVHDLGHGPFSHTFDYGFLPAARSRVRLPDDLMTHEARSVKLFEHCVDKYQIDLEKEDIRCVASLIRGEKHNASTLIPKFLYDVVANSTTGIDTDKFDYIARDTYNVGLRAAYGFDCSRLINFAKVVQDNICFHRKELFNVYHLFLTRFQLHRTVYNHRAALSIDAMITDAFIHADSQLEISTSINDPEEFLHMTDCLLPIIERSKGSSLATSRNIIRRLRTRKLYRFVEEVLLPAGISREIKPEDITTCQNSGMTGITLRPEDVYIAHVTLNFGMGQENPLDRVLFFKDWSDMDPATTSSRSASYVLPAHFEERIIRIYHKREVEDDHDVKQAVSEAFRCFLDRQNLGSAPRWSPPPTPMFPDIDSESNVAECGDSRVLKRMKPDLGKTGE